MKLTITFIRHAPTLANKEGVFMGIQDVPCDIQVLEKSNLRFFDIEKHTLYCSPLKRALKSAEYIFPNTKIIIDQRLIEKNLGDWSGQSKNYLRRKFPEAFLESGHLNPFYVPNQGESFEKLKDRSISFLRDIISRHSNNKKDLRIYIVTHNGVIRSMRCIIEEMDPFQFFKTSELFLTPIDYTFEISEWITKMNCSCEKN